MVKLFQGWRLRGFCGVLFWWLYSWWRLSFCRDGRKQENIVFYKAKPTLCLYARRHDVLLFTSVFLPDSVSASELGEAHWEPGATADLAGAGSVRQSDSEDWELGGSRGSWVSRGESPGLGCGWVVTHWAVIIPVLSTQSLLVLLLSVKDNIWSPLILNCAVN